MYYFQTIMNFFSEIIVLTLALIGIWIGAGLSLNSVEKLATNLKHSSFLTSFFVLGFFTSLTEISVALNSIVDETPQISAGNLLGGVIVLLLLVIPALGLFGKGIKLNHSFGSKGILFCIIFLIIPFVLLLDKSFSAIDGFIVLFLYFCLAFYLYSKDKNVESEIIENVQSQKKLQLFLTIILGVTILIIASNFLVEEINSLATALNLSPFVISLLGLSIGTNLPEITLAIRSVLSGKTQIALGNYLGSAVFNVFILGILGILSGNFVVQYPLYIPLTFSVLGFTAFYFFIKSSDFLSKKESAILILTYFVFVLLESLVYLR